MAPPSYDRSAGARGALVGALAGGGADPLREALAEELAEGRTDLRLLAERWVARYRATPGAVDTETAAALEILAAQGAPPTAGGRGGGALARTVPVALVAFRAPRTLVSATLHIAALTHPDPAAAWSAVAVNVALGVLLHGRRDVVPEVLEALTGNRAPAELIAAVRRVPVNRREALPSPAAVSGDAVAAAAFALGLLQHEPLAARGFDLLRAAGPTPAGAAAGALLGARAGDAAIPVAGLDPVSLISWRRLGDRLLQRVPAPAGGSRS